jgi:hypothetical protein
MICRRRFRGAELPSDKQLGSISAPNLHPDDGFPLSRARDLVALLSKDPGGRGLPLAWTFGYSLALCLAIMAGKVAGFSDTAVFTGDTWEFQSVAVNFAKGRGFPKFGQIGAFEEYRFELVDVDPPHRPKFVAAGANGGQDHFYRTPGYPFALGCVYRLFGVRPALAKAVQAFLLALSAAMLVWVGRELWGDAGTVSGMFAGPLYCAVYGYQAGLILTEPLLVPCLIAVAASYLAWRRRPSAGRAMLVGAALAAALAVKGSVVFLPLGFAFLMVAAGAQSATASARSRHAATALATAFLCIAPYSAFASLRSGRFVALSTQGGFVLLDNNNEFSVAKRAWSADWRRDPASFYNRPSMAGLPPWRRVVLYYAARPGDLGRALAYKLESGFKLAVFLKFVLVALVVDVFGRLMSRRARAVWPEGVRARAAVLLVLLFGGAAAAASRLVGFLALTAFAALAVPRGAGGVVWPLVTGLHIAFLANFVAVMSIIDGVPRYFSVVEPLFILLAFRVLIATVLAPMSWAESMDALRPGEIAP